MNNRKKIPVDIKRSVLHLGGFKCGNPACRSILTLDIHHIVQVSDNGENKPDNLIALCPNCHALHHRGEIPIESIRAWKLILLALNEAFDQKSIDQLLSLSLIGDLYVSGDGVLQCSALIANNLIDAHAFSARDSQGPAPWYKINLSNKGKFFVEAWKEGNQEKALKNI